MKTISLVIPVYNEEKRLRNIFEALSKLQLPTGLKLDKVIFVNDGSTDKTDLLLHNFRRINDTKKRIYIRCYENNKGKGHAVRLGMLTSKADYTLILDADMSTKLSELKKFVPWINQNTAVIVGTRKNGKSTVIIHQPLYRELLGKGFTFLTNTLLGMHMSDFTCGFKAFSNNAKDMIFPSSRIKRWGYDAEIIFLARKYNLSIQEVPVVWSDKKGSRVNITKDILVSLKELFHIRIAYAPLLPSFSPVLRLSKAVTSLF